MRNRTPAPHTDSASPAAWYRQPVLWLGAFVLLASLAGCVWMIVLGAQYVDPPVATHGTIFKVPLARPAPAPEAPRNEP